MTAPTERALGADAATLRGQQQVVAAALVGCASAGAVSAAVRLCQPGQQPDADGLAVYRNAYAVRLRSALRDNFEILARALGDDGFDALTAAYVATHPPTQPSIRWLGDQLADFMSAPAQIDSGLTPHPALADLARMDWALRSAFDAADAPVLSRQALASVAPDDWPALVLVLHPSVGLCALHWDVAPAWHALRAAADGDEPELPAPVARPHKLLVWRRGLDTQWRSLADAEAALLHAVALGQNFGALCEQAAGLVPNADEAVPLVVGALEQWLADGLVSRLASDSTTAG